MIVRVPGLGVVVAGVVGALGFGKLGGGLGVGLGVQVFDFGFAEDAKGVWVSDTVW